MTITQMLFGAVLMLLLTAILPALTSSIADGRERAPFRNYLRFHAHMLLRSLRGFSLADALWSDYGAVTVTYTSQFPNTGTTTAPTALNARGLRVQTATVSFTDTDTQAVITHNMGAAGLLPASFASFNYPIFFVNKLLGGASETSFGTDFTFGLANSNSITMNKISVGAGSGGTWLITILSIADALL